MKILVSCEHAGNDIPEKYTALLKGCLDSVAFRDFHDQLKTHRGYDIGALEVATKLYSDLKSAGNLQKSGLIAFRWFGWSRLLIDPNRSAGHKNLFSEWSKKLDPKTRKEIKETIYFFYRFEIEQLVRSYEPQRFLHIGVHSFTPVMNAEKRNCDIGFLYDPHNVYEKAFANNAVFFLRKMNLKARRNYPYQGRSDGLTTYLRKKYKHYAGVEIEINQSVVHRHETYYNELLKAVTESMLLLDRTG